MIHVQHAIEYSTVNLVISKAEGCRTAFTLVVHVLVMGDAFLRRHAELGKIPVQVDDDNNTQRVHAGKKYHKIRKKVNYHKTLRRP